MQVQGNGAEQGCDPTQQPANLATVQRPAPGSGAAAPKVTAPGVYGECGEGAQDPEEAPAG